MAAALVDRATSGMLIGPDWSINLEICDFLNGDPGQAKGLVKLLKKRINSKHSKVQLLTLTLLETLIKNCGDVVHMHVAEKDIPHEMVKIVKKKTDFHVKEKILVLIDTWQEAFGGPRARYPQYYVAYQKLLRAGVVFPQKPESSAPVFTPPQTQPLSSYPQSIRKPELHNEAPESSARFNLPQLSMTEIENARGIVGILSEMLSAMDPSNKEGLKQEVIVDLVEQCRSYKQRVIQFISTTSEERPLSQGLALNDDLQRVLAQHDAIASGIAVKVEKQRPVANIPKLDIKTQDTILQSNGKIPTSASNASGQSSVTQSLPPATPMSNGSMVPLARVPQIDLLSGDFNPPENENPLALVPVSIYPSTSMSDQNVLALSDVFAQNTIVNNQPPSSFNSRSAYPMPQVYTTASSAQMTQMRKLYLHSSIGGANLTLPQIEQSRYVQANKPDKVNQTWNDQNLNTQQLKPLSIDGGNDQSGGSLPPPPWEMHQTEGIQLEPMQFQQPQGTQMGGIYHQHMGHSPRFTNSYSPIRNSQMVGAIPYQTQSGPVLASQIRASQMAGGGYIYERWVVPLADAPYPYYDQTKSQYPYPYSNANNLPQRMYGMHMQDNSSSMNANPSYQLPTLSSSPSSKQLARPSRPEDKLFGDLVDFAKSKQNKST